MTRTHAYLTVSTGNCGKKFFLPRVWVNPEHLLDEQHGVVLVSLNPLGKNILFCHIRQVYRLGRFFGSGHQWV